VTGSFQWAAQQHLSTCTITCLTADCSLLLLPPLLLLLLLLALLVVIMVCVRWEIMLGPIVKAAKATFKDPKREIWISLQGEMGATLAFFPDQWLALAQQLRQEYGSGGSKLMVGVTWVS
jgi:hypothetical protein